MKKYLSILVICLLACSASKKITYDVSDCNIIDKISEDEKTLNIEAYKDILFKKGYYKFIDNDTLTIYLDYGKKDEYWKRHHNKITGIEKIIAYNSKTLRVQNSFFLYKNGNFNIGNEYYYNEQGQIIKTIDHNQYQKYPICYKDIIKSTIKKAGKKYYFQALERDSIINNDNINYNWKVYFEDSISKYPTLGHKFFRIDAKTNKTISEKIVN